MLVSTQAFSSRIVSLVSHLRSGDRPISYIPTKRLHIVTRAAAVYVYVVVAFSRAEAIRQIVENPYWKI